MNKIKKLVLILSLILIIILIMLLIIKFNNKKNEDNVLSEQKEPSGEESYDGTKVALEETSFERVKYNYEYYPIVEIIKNFISEANETSNENVIINMLSSNYIRKFNISNNNLQEHIDIFEDNEYQIKDMYSSIIKNNIQVYLVYGKLKQNEYNFMITVDLDNNAFGIYLNDYINNSDYSQENIKTLKLQENSIEKNDNNHYVPINVSSEEMAKKYFEDFKEKIEDNPREIYNLLDGDYKNAIFSDYAYFNEYFNQQKSKIEDATLLGYKVKNYENYNQYICVDSNNYYYIFNVEAVMKYTFILINNDIEYNNENYILNNDKTGLSDFKFDVTGIPNECVEVINEIEVYNNVIKEYVYMHGLTEADSAIYQGYNYNDEKKILDIIFKLNDKNRTTLLAALYLETGELQLKQY